jgi:hypothetical protein
MEQIMSGDCDIKKFISWNIDHRISVLKNEHDECVGMIMKMDNSRYDDMVFITLSWDDTYRIRFVNKNFEILKDIEGIYCDQLYEVIDNTMDSVMKVEFSLN